MIHSNVSLSELKGGAVEELYQKLLGIVLANIQDPNSPAGKGSTRKISIEMKLTPNKDRSFIEVDVEAGCKLANPAPVATSFTIKEDGEYLIAFEPEQANLFSARSAN
jgi:hypothetical protein